MERILVEDVKAAYELLGTNVLKQGFYRKLRLEWLPVHS